MKRGACFEASVVEVVSGDMVGIATNDAEVLHSWRVAIGGIKAPAFGRKEMEKPPPGKEEVKSDDQPWAWESKEFLRESVVGKRVTVLVEKLRTTKSNAQIAVVSMWIQLKGKNYKNVACSLLERGLATLQFPRVDEDAVRNFEDLSVASEQAKTKKNGVHSGKAPQAPKFNELYGRDNKQRAKDYERYLVGKKKVEGVVEAVMGVNRYKLRVNANNVRISFACQGVRSVLSKDE